MSPGLAFSINRLTYSTVKWVHLNTNGSILTRWRQASPFNPGEGPDRIEGKRAEGFPRNKRRPELWQLSTI
jgi:hypothetical protein